MDEVLELGNNGSGRWDKYSNGPAIFMRGAGADDNCIGRGGVGKSEGDGQHD